MINQNGRLVLYSSHLGHLSNLDGREPAASSLTEEKLDALVIEFMNHVAVGGAQLVEHAGSPRFIVVAVIVFALSLVHFVGNP